MHVQNYVKKPYEGLLIDIQYLPPVSWFLLACNYDKAYLDIFSNYKKATFANRCHLLGANGVQRLSIPLQKGKNQKTPLHDVKISYDFNWQKNHWATITSCYRRSPYFEFYEDLFYPFYHNKFESLVEFNFILIQQIQKILKLDKKFFFTDKYIEPQSTDLDDYRNKIFPQQPNSLNLTLPVYNQVFSDRIAFIEDLSILDLVCNTGSLRTQ
jgi:hypothetical protein